MTRIDFEVITDGNNDAAVKALAGKPDVEWDEVPRVGDEVTIEGESYTVKVVFWDYPDGTVLVRDR